MSTPTISRSKWPLSRAADARCCESAAHSSWDSRLTLQRSATFSAVIPIEMYTLYEAPSEPSRCGFIRGNVWAAPRDTHSTPAAMY